MSATVILNLVVGAVVGWLSGFLPFVRQIGVSNVTRLVTNIISGIIGGGIGATVIGSALGGSGASAIADIPSLLGAVGGAGIFSTLVSFILSLIKKK